MKDFTVVLKPTNPNRNALLVRVQAEIFTQDHIGITFHANRQPVAFFPMQHVAYVADESAVIAANEQAEITDHSGGQFVSEFNSRS